MLLRDNNMSKPDSAYTYVIEQGYNPNHIPVDAVKKLFNYENTKYDDIYEYSIDSLGMLHHKRRNYGQ